jgi:predicted nucleic acid-binding protein
LTKAFVADASVAIGWVHPGQETADTAALLQAIEDGAIIEVPALWPLEVANVLTVLVRRRKLTEDERQTALLWLDELPLRIDHEMAALAFSRLAELAAKHQLSVYDAAYLELAQRRNLPLACHDGPLRQAASRLGISLWKNPGYLPIGKP